MKRGLYRALWVAEVIAILLFALALALPIQDYAMREYREYYRHPSPETLKAFREKQQQEFLVRLIVAAPFGAAAVLLPFVLFRRRKSN